MLRAAAALLLIGLALAGSAAGAASYTGPVSGVPWSPATLPAATTGVAYSATITPAPAGATQLFVSCNTKSIGSFPPPPIAFNDCPRLPPGLTATGGSTLTVSGTPTQDGTYPFRLIAVWKDASGGDSYTLQSFSISVTSGAGSPKCHCAKVGVTLNKVVVAGASTMVSATLALDCTSGSGATCAGAVALHQPAGKGAAAWTGLQLPGDDTLQPVKGKATIPLHCFAPCGHGATVPVQLRLGPTSAANRAGARWTIAAVATCAGGASRTRVLVLQFDRAGRLDLRRSKLS